MHRDHVRRTSCVVAVVIGLIIAIHARDAHAVCGTGGRKLVGHLNDVFFDATISTLQERTIEGKIVNTGYGPNGEAWIACDIWARTTIPGLYIENAYGSGNYAPPNTWASIAQ